MLVLYFELRSQFTNPEKVLVQCVLPAGLAFSLLAPLIPEGNQFYEVMNKLMNTRLPFQIFSDAGKDYPVRTAVPSGG